MTLKLQKHNCNIEVNMILHVLEPNSTTPTIRRSPKDFIIPSFKKTVLADLTLIKAYGEKRNFGLCDKSCSIHYSTVF
ncbi:hypothetical protein SAMN06265348_106106 [Pedobacter westerhofensis]|uniref:Uncharacterized protein n=1 Tax=Pedobacter westerhofensis TaxID=425512 RepID=A0A521DRH5_9SPHI|nr:hypothetical protein SAMN06265348_106106 [Pedobacter westerhofensis]